MTEWSEPEIPFLMDDVRCESASTNFLSCSSSAEDCDHAENVLLTCFSSGKTSCNFYFMLRLTKLVSRTDAQICHRSIVNRANRELFNYYISLFYCISQFVIFLLKASENPEILNLPTDFSNIFIHTITNLII